MKKVHTSENPADMLASPYSYVRAFLELSWCPQHVTTFQTLPSSITLQSALTMYESQSW